MSAIADRVALSAALPIPRRTGIRFPVGLWVAASLLLVLFAGTWGALFLPKGAGWQRLDPHGISTSMGTVGNVLGAAAVRWDSVDYLTIAQHGYTGARSSVYFPLYPILIGALTPPGVSPVIAGVLISLVAFATGLTLLHRMVSWQLGKRIADATVLLLAFSPFSFVFSAVYSTSLMFACAVGAFYLARQQRFFFASLVAACAALTHVDGILVLAPLAFMYWKGRGCPKSLRRLWSPRLPALALPGLALGGLFLYMQVQGWGWLAPITNQNVATAGRTLVSPPVVLFQTVRDIVTELNPSLHKTIGGVFPPAAQNIFYLLVLAAAVGALVTIWHRLPTEYALFGCLAMLVCTSSAVGLEPLKGLDRYMLPIFPLWIGAATWLESRRLTAVAVTASSALLLFFTIDFTSWIPVF